MRRMDLSRESSDETNPTIHNPRRRLTQVVICTVRASSWTQCLLRQLDRVMREGVLAAAVTSTWWRFSLGPRTALSRSARASPPAMSAGASKAPVPKSVSGLLGPPSVKGGGPSTMAGRDSVPADLEDAPWRVAARERVARERKEQECRDREDARSTPRGRAKQAVVLRAREDALSVGPVVISVKDDPVPVKAMPVWPGLAPSPPVAALPVPGNISPMDDVDGDGAIDALLSAAARAANRGETPGSVSAASSSMVPEGPGGTPDALGLAPPRSAVPRVGIYTEESIRFDAWKLNREAGHPPVCWWCGVSANEDDTWCPQCGADFEWEVDTYTGPLGPTSKGRPSKAATTDLTSQEHARS